MERFDQYPYIDLEDGLTRTMNNKKLYAKLLTSFINNPREKELADALEARDADAAIAAAHTIKGIAANLSMLRLRYLCAWVEEQFKNAKTAGDMSAFDNLDRVYIFDCLRETVEKARQAVDAFTQG